MALGKLQSLLVLPLLALLFAAPLAAQDVAGAKSFLAEAYRHYTRNSKGIQHYDHYLHSSLRALMDADAKAVGTDIPVSGDGDLFCDCQDWEGIWDLKIDVKPLDKERAEADVTFFLSDPKDPKVGGEAARSLHYVLAVENGGWRVWNVISYRKSDKSSFDLRAEMVKEIQLYADQAKQKKAK
jgi:hypothetical protein